MAPKEEVEDASSVVKKDTCHANALKKALNNQEEVTELASIAARLDI